MKKIPHLRPTNTRYHHSKFSCLGDLACMAVHHWSITPSQMSSLRRTCSTLHQGSQTTTVWAK